MPTTIVSLAKHLRAMASSSSDSRSKPFQTLTTASSTVPLRHGAPDAEGPSEQDAQADEKQDWRFWAVFASLSLTSFVCALNQGVLIPAMPSIVHELGGTYDYIWAFTSYNLAQYVRPRALCCSGGESADRKRAERASGLLSGRCRTAWGDAGPFSRALLCLPWGQPSVAVASTWPC